ncbi:MAG: PAS domain S-box protein [Burkholderiales bacterium]|nr:PAS domain S-box protein [Burkholderiales bacterium]
MRFNPYSLRFKLLLASTLVETIMLSFLLFNATRLIDNAMLASTEAALKQAVTMLNVATAPYLVQGDYATMQDNLNEIVGNTDQGVVYVVVRNTAARIVAKAGVADAKLLPAASRSLNEALAGAVLHVERPLSLAGQHVGTLNFGLSTKIIAQAKGTVFEQSSLIAIAEIGLTFVLLSALGYWLTRNLGRFVEISRAIADGHYEQRLPERGHDEVASLARNFNRMVAAVASKIGQLHASEHEFRSLFEQAAVGLAHIGFAGEWLRYNHTLCEILGYEYGEMEAAGLYSVWPADDAASDALAREELLAGGRSHYVTELRLRRNDAQMVWVRLTVSLFRQESGEAKYFVYVMQDISAAKQAELDLARYLERDLENKILERTEQLRELNEQLEVRVEARTHELRLAMDQIVESEKLASLGQIVAGVAHELNTPIGNVILMSTTIDEKIADLSKALRLEKVSRLMLSGAVADIQHGNSIIIRSARLASELIESFKRVAVDQTSHRRRQFDLRVTLEDILNTLSTLTRHARVTVELKVPPGIRMDSFPGHLEQIFNNLIVNSIKHGFPGKENARITIDASVQTDWIEIIYQDNGHGIEKRLHRKVFEPFYTTQMAQGGSGLGMYIVHNLIYGVLKGSLKLESDKEQGLRLIFHVPATTP